MDDDEDGDDDEHGGGCIQFVRTKVVHASMDVSSGFGLKVGVTRHQLTANFWTGPAQSCCVPV